MKDASGTFMKMADRNTPFLCFIMATDSTIANFNDFVAKIDITMRSDHTAAAIEISCYI